MKRKTYNNVIKASKLIMKKGYEQKEAQEMALRIFENMEQLKNGMSAEWFIEKIAQTLSQYPDYVHFFNPFYLQI